VEWNVDGTVGGSHQLLYDLVHGLDRARFEPVVLFYQHNRFSDLLRRQEVDVVEFDEISEREQEIRSSGTRLEKYADFVGAVFRRMQVIRRHGIDLVHLINSPWGGADDWLPACRGARVPCIATACGLLPADAPMIQRTLFRGFDRILASSRAVAEQLSDLGVRSNVEVLHLGVDLEAFRGSATRPPGQVRAALNVPPGRILLTMVGNVRPWKGQHVVLEALARLPENIRERFFLLLAGRVPEASIEYAAQLQAMIERPELRGHARFLGERLDVADLFAASDVAVHASVWPEPFGLVLVEALSVGTPVIAADRGGPVEILTHDSGWLFDPENPAALADLLRGIAEAPDVLDGMSRPARARAEEFSAPSMVARVQQVYDAVRST
jgi:glycosyltransferase involved in cell wall biosynthesis